MAGLIYAKGSFENLLLPLVLEQLLAVSVGLADTFMVSKVGEAAVSGVALVDSLNLFVIQVMAAFAAGGIVVISQYRGKGDSKLSYSAGRHLEVLLFSFAVFPVELKMVCLLTGTLEVSALP